MGKMKNLYWKNAFLVKERAKITIFLSIYYFTQQTCS